MNKGIAVSLLVVATILVGGLSMGCIDAPVVIPDEPEDNGGLTAKGLQVKADVEERQARGFVQYTGETPVNTTSEVEVITYKEQPVISYCGCFVLYPGNVAGFDTPIERAYLYQTMLNAKVASMDISKQYSQSGGETAYLEFYLNYYQGLQDKYEKMYCGVGNKVIGDFDCGNFTIEEGNSTGNGSA